MLLQYGSATRYKAFVFHTCAKRARNAFDIFANAFHSCLLHVSFAFAPRFIRVCSAFHLRLPRVRYLATHTQFSLASARSLATPT